MCVSGSVISDSLQPHGLSPARRFCPWDSPGKNTGVDCHSLLQRIFPTHGSKPGLLHCRQILYCLSYMEGHVLAMINNAAMNIGVHVSFQISVSIFFGYIPRGGIGRLYGSSVFRFLRNLHPIVAAPVYLPTDRAQGFPFLHILNNICSL